ncbi:Hypothetical protein SMAX5B_019846 [Scophthalmus maximus]|uniref:Uncharacterized protein n=1 Tax=Scophthalmus maximus TaxID=52904 RepID=A0A2U9B3W4_SCOMX|nr:Hypothetical protein SMAX5B_019846 [Scophthalmus maximus]
MRSKGRREGQCRALWRRREGRRLLEGVRGSRHLFEGSSWSCQEAEVSPGDPQYPRTSALKPESHGLRRPPPSMSDHWRDAPRDQAQ